MKSTENKLIKFALEQGDEIFFKILNDYPEIDDEDVRRIGIIHSIMTNCIYYMYSNGYSEKELINEVLDWCEIARNDKNDNDVS